MTPFADEIRTIEQLDRFINYLVNNKIYYLSDDAFPPMAPEIKKMYIVYSQAVQSKSVQEALNLYNSLIAFAPNFVAARYNIATLLRKSGNLEEALHQYQLAAQYNPLDPMIFIGIGGVFSMQGKKKEAIEVFLHILRMTPVDDLSGSNLTIRWMSMLNIGIAYRETQEYRKSLEWLEMALAWATKHEKLASFREAWDGELIATYYELGNLYRDFGDQFKSEEMYLRGVEIGKQNKSSNQDLRRDETLIWSNLGELYLSTRRWSDAETFLGKCLMRHPNEKYFQLLLEKARGKNPGQ